MFRFRGSRVWEFKGSPLSVKPKYLLLFGFHPLAEEEP